MTLTEAVDHGSLRVTDGKADVLSYRYFDSAEFESLGTENVDSCRWVVDPRAMATGRNGEVHPARALIAQVPVGESGSQADHALGRTRAHDDEVDLVDSGCLSQLEKSSRNLEEEARVAGLVEVTPGDPVLDCISGAKDHSQGPEPIKDRQTFGHV
ncbi:MAG: hypothetical protein WB565_14435 [Acidimicrobiales bacterium]